MQPCSYSLKVSSSTASGDGVIEGRIAFSPFMWVGTFEASTVACFTLICLSLQEISQWVILKRFSTADSANHWPHSRLQSAVLPTTRITSFHWLWLWIWEMWMRWSGASVEGYRLQENRTVWTAVGGATAMPHFSEWNYSSYTSPSLSRSRRIRNTGSSLVEPPRDWRQTGSLVDGSRARASILPPVSALARLKKKRCKRCQMTVWHKPDKERERVLYLFQLA